MADQRALWRHYQVHEAGAFAGARPRLDGVARRTARRVRPGGNVLTVGAGDGYLERVLAQRGYRVHVLDPVGETVAAMAALGFTAREGVLQQIPFTDELFDAVVASEVLEHLAASDNAAALAEVRRMLKPGGWFLGSVPASEDLLSSTWTCAECGHRGHAWGHQQSFTADQLRALLDATFGSVAVSRTTFPDFRRRTPGGLAKSAARWALGRAGWSAADPKLVFQAQRQA